MDAMLFPGKQTVQSSDWKIYHGEISTKNEIKKN
jgi:hypothetical protein